MKRYPFPPLALFFAIFATFLCAFHVDASESPYQVVWDSPSENWDGTMPLGNGEVCVNAYVDGSGVLHALIARTDSWDDYARLAKVGLVELSLLGDKFDAALMTPFRQTLDVEQGMITAVFGPEGRETRVKLWVDVNAPDVVAEIDSDVEVAPVARVRLVRTGQEKPIAKPETSDIWWKSFKAEENEQIRLFPDKFLDVPSLKASNRIGVYHRNVKTPYFDEVAKEQGFDDRPGHADPYVDRTFGVVVSSDFAVWRDTETLAASPCKSCRFDITTHTAQTATFDEWFEQIVQLADAATSVSFEERRAATQKYWQEFAQRSWIRFSPNEKAIASLSADERAAVAAETFDVTRGYALKRFMVACEGRGNFPIKFNGELFTVPPANNREAYDFRNWGPGYWWQNTRLPYYSMFASGDLEFTKSFFDMYCSLVPVCEYRTKKYFGFDNCCYFPECIYFTGEVFPQTYGLTPWNERENKLQSSGWHMREWVGGLELALLAIQYYEHTLDDEFLQTQAIPTANSILRFFDNYYSVDPATGKLKMSPSQSLETWWDCDNAAPEIAGIHGVIARLLALPESKTSAADREYWRALDARTPDHPTRVDEKSGKTLLAPADRYAHKSNYEAGELYSVFPFRLFSFEKPNADWARLAYQLRLDPMDFGWSQDDLFCAYLGDAEGARKNLVSRSRKYAPNTRFPGFWGPNFNYVPDGDHGGVLLTAAQSLVLQADGDSIFVTPALPKNWDVEFKLWAPKRTVLQGKVVDGAMKELIVEPKEREKDVQVIGR